jgi:hypothetical protein
VISRGASVLLWSAGAVACLALITASPRSFAQDHTHLRPPPAPEDEEPVLAVEVHVGAVVPIVNQALCPEATRCVFGGGAGIGASVERRFAEGYGIALGYDAWFLESSGLYELPTLQILRASVRFAFYTERLMHLVLEGGLGALVFGDTFRISSAGGALHLGVTGELELTESIAFTLGVVARVFTTSGFLALTDETGRRLGDGANAGLALQAGILIVDP